MSAVYQYYKPDASLFPGNFLLECKAAVFSCAKNWNTEQKKAKGGTYNFTKAICECWLSPSSIGRPRKLLRVFFDIVCHFIFLTKFLTMVCS